jgi:hypothetical protein
MVEGKGVYEYINKSWRCSRIVFIVVEYIVFVYNIYSE